MTLSEACSYAGLTGHTLVGDCDVSRFVMDSRAIQPGDIFVAYPSVSSDSHSYIATAIEKGAVGAIVHSEQGLDYCQGIAGLWVDDTMRDAARLCNVVYGNPSSKMRVIGITGTNGKTTTAWILRDMLEALGVRAGYLGTLGASFGDKHIVLNNTTPFSVDYYNLLRDMVDAGTEAAAFEVSSHAMEQGRMLGTEFELAVFTNLTQDHLDFHGSMSAYRAAKWKLFSDPQPEVAVYNLDDECGREWASTYPGKMVNYSFDSESGAHLVAGIKSIGIDRIELTLSCCDEVVDIHSRLGGNYNASNLLCACATLLAMDYSLAEVASVTPQATPVPGRFEPVPNELGIGVLVDYAHTPDAIEKLLSAARDVTPGRLITVFGCGGDRDATKRPLMAKAVASNSDLVIVTSDNPRTEDPDAIIKDVVSGLIHADHQTIPDRREAIIAALTQAKVGDTVVIAGKGHEDYQIIGKTKLPFDDRLVAKEALDAR